MEPTTKTKNTNGKVKCLVCPKETRSDKYIEHIVRYHRAEIISSYGKNDRDILIKTQRPYLVYSKRQQKGQYDFAICLECRQGTTPYSRKCETPAKFINTHHTTCKCKEVFDAKFKSEFESTELDGLTIQMSVPTTAPAVPGEQLISNATQAKLVEFLTVKGKGFVEDSEEEDEDDEKPTNDNLVLTLMRCYVGRGKNTSKLAEERDKLKKRIEKLDEALEEEQEKCLELERENEILKEKYLELEDKHESLQKKYEEAYGQGVLELANEIVFG